VVQGFALELVQQEILVTSKSNQEIHHEKGTAKGESAPYQIRILTRYEIADGCPMKDDKIAFSIPMKGLEHLTPTLKNIFNKFSVKYFVKLGIFESDKDEPSTVHEVWSKPFEIVFYK
jgi:hypothetical protein